ncbi:hypothetical protein ElyMa_000735500 [Elysia marginata]|uniref:Uncharacterized protein n=1 Tax=Elysia marginata TaxID=1093978 RepID=A0AAV4GP13_9GAST|nr:hypothetical protein ElyMa_000735500 [Elysia marginata]
MLKKAVVQTQPEKAAVPGIVVEDRLSDKTVPAHLSRRPMPGPVDRHPNTCMADTRVCRVPARTQSKRLQLQFVRLVVPVENSCGCLYHSHPEPHGATERFRNPRKAPVTSCKLKQASRNFYYVTALPIYLMHCE